MQETKLINYYLIDVGKMRKIFLLLVCILISLSCSITKKFSYSSELYGNKESFGWDLLVLLDYYTQTYNEPPKNAEDIMIYIQNIDKKSRIVYEGYYKYDNHYEYFKNNKDNLIFVTDSMISIYYDKIKNENLLVQTVIANSCDNINSAQVNFFDKQGYWFSSDTLSDFVIKRLIVEYKKSFQQLKDSCANEVIYTKTILEYTPAGLKDLCYKKSLINEQSKFYENSFNFLDSLASTSNISRITIPSFIININQN